MYARFFGLAHEPFSIAPDPRYLFMSTRHREALAHLLYGLGGGGGFVLLSGEIGAGKTTVCRCFLEQIPPNCNVAYIFNPKLTVIELLKAVCAEFGVAVEPPPGEAATVTRYVDPLNGFLLDAHAAGRNNVLIIDEAQNLSADVLEQLRLLTNLETTERKLLQIILIGQPELRALLARTELEQLAQRVIARFHLEALSEAETGQYIRHRLAVAGLSRSLPFDREALKRIHRLTRGVPRHVNLLCDRAMLGAYASGEPHIGAGIVDRAAREVFGHADAAPVATPRRQAALALGGAAAVGAALAFGAVHWRGDATAQSPGARAAGAAPAAARAPASGAAASGAAAGTSAPASVHAAGGASSAAVGTRIADVRAASAGASGANVRAGIADDRTPGRAGPATSAAAVGAARTATATSPTATRSAASRAAQVASSGPASAALRPSARTAQRPANRTDDAMPSTAPSTAARRTASPGASRTAEAPVPRPVQPAASSPSDAVAGAIADAASAATAATTSPGARQPATR